MARQFTFIPEVIRRHNTRKDGRTPEYSHWIRYNTFYGLIITTTLSTVLLVTELFEWRATGSFFTLANRFPGTVALTVQLLAAFFGLIHVAVICKLINYALRLRLMKASVTLDVLRTWVNMSIVRVDWDLPLRFFFPVLITVLLSLVPAALWAGSITPLIARTTGSGTLLLPSYEDVSLIKEYPMGIGKSGPSLRNQKGFFTYSVGQQHIGELLSSAASASADEANAPAHRKIDNTQFSYRSRSYGVGAPAGLTDAPISSNNQAAGYMYQEKGYLCNVTCTYNETSDFSLSGPVNEWIYAASGNLPDSAEGPAYSNYIGHDGKAIVAMGVSFSELSPRRYLALAAGEAYSFLKNIQCKLEFTPTLFNVTVDLSNLNITVRPVDSTILDFNPQRNLTRTAVRQFELLSNDLTNLYVSQLGDALNSSIATYKMSRSSALRNPFTSREATLAGVTNSVTAMADDMLVAYGAAQLMVGRVFTPATATVYIFALQFGQRPYIYSIFALNLLIVLAVMSEAVRTHGWRSLGRFNYLDPRDLIIAASRGGGEVARAADRRAGKVVRGEKGCARHVWLLSDPDEGNGGLVVKMKGDDEGHNTLVIDDVDDEESQRAREKLETLEDSASEFDDVDEKGEIEMSKARDYNKRANKRKKVGLFGFT